MISSVLASLTAGIGTRYYNKFLDAALAVNIVMAQHLPTWLRGWCPCHVFLTILMPCGCTILPAAAVTSQAASPEEPTIQTCAGISSGPQGGHQTT